jgi:2-iminobutanoate/2-iminopropanoate deaminase
MRQTLVLGGGSKLGGAEPLISDATRWNDLLFLSGRAAVDPATGAPVAETFDAQARVVIDDVLRVLAAAGSAAEHVLRVECWLADAGDFSAWNDLFAATFPAPRPARTTLVSGFAVPGLLIELQVTAGVPS